MTTPLVLLATGALALATAAAPAPSTKPASAPVFRFKSTTWRVLPALPHVLPMRLNSIKLSGFKSFAEPTNFQLPGQLVGVLVRVSMRNCSECRHIVQRLTPSSLERCGAPPLLTRSPRRSIVGSVTGSLAPLDPEARWQTTRKSATNTCT